MHRAGPGLGGAMASVDPRLVRLKELLEQKAILHGDFTLTSGKKSPYYFDGRLVTHDAEGITLIGELVQEILQGAGVDAVGGPSVGANPIITATLIASHRAHQPLDGFFVRPERKQYGTGKLIEGTLPSTPGAAVAIVEDSVTTGGSLRRGPLRRWRRRATGSAKSWSWWTGAREVSSSLRAGGYDVEALLNADGDKIIAP